MLRRPKGQALTRKVLETFHGDSHFQSINPIPRQSEPETIRIELRKNAIICLYYLMIDWPTSFVTTCKELNIFTQDIFSAWLCFPYWLQNDVTFFIKRQWMPLSDAERKSARKFLEVQFNRRINDYEISRMLHKIQQPDI